MDAGLALGAWDETMPLKQGIKYDLRDRKMVPAK